MTAKSEIMFIVPATAYYAHVARFVLFQAAGYYCVRAGFELMAYQGLETGERNVVSHAVRQDKVRQGNQTTALMCCLAPWLLSSNQCFLWANNI